MSTTLSSAGRPAFLTINQTAWVLGVPRATVSAMIRRRELRTVRRRDGLAVSTTELARLLGGAT